MSKPILKSKAKVELSIEHLIRLGNWVSDELEKLVNEDYEAVRLDIAGAGQPEPGHYMVWRRKEIRRLQELDEILNDAAVAAGAEAIAKASRELDGNFG